VVRRYLGESVVKAIKSTRIPAVIWRCNEVKMDRRAVPPLSEDERQHLKELFAEEIQRLEALIGKDLSHWK
jgi:hypothetical protein